MKKLIVSLCAAAALLSSCKMENPLLSESPLPYGAPQFDKIRNEHYIPAIKQGIAEGKAEIDAIVSNPDAPTFENTIEALAYSGSTAEKVLGIFYNLKEANTNEEMERIAEEVSPLLTEYEMYTALNAPLFARVKAVYDQRESLGLDRARMRLLEDTYKGFVRSGALLSDEDKETYSKLEEELSLTQLQWQKNALDATNAWTMNITDEAELEGLPQYVRDMGAALASERGEEGWTFDLSQPSYSSFMQFSSRRDIREKYYMAYNSKALGGEFDNTEICRRIVDLRIRIANILGYETYADYAIEDRMVGDKENVMKFLGELLEPSLPAARKEVADVFAFAKANGFDDSELKAWDFSYWSEKYKNSLYDLSDEMLKPYFQLEDCIDAVLGLATRLYGVTFEERKDIPAYHEDVHVFDLKDENGQHLAVFYADFFPRTSKRGGAWMNSIYPQYVKDGVDNRPFVYIVTNFSKPTASSPSLLTHYELTTFLHEFGHALHGMLTKCTYPGQSGTSVDHDFVELPSQIMENWGYERDFLKTFAKHYQTGEVIPDELIDKIIASKNYHAAYAQVRQLQFGYLDMNWYTRTELPEKGTEAFEASVYEPLQTLPLVPGTCMSTSFSHIFAGGYAAGYYSYKWAEVLEADAFSLFEEKGIFNKEVADSFRRNILEKGSTEKEAVLYRNFRGHDPETSALLKKLGII